jgi:hypothetical protein
MFHRRRQDVFEHKSDKTITPSIVKVTDIPTIKFIIFVSLLKILSLFETK